MRKQILKIMLWCVAFPIASWVVSIVTHKAIWFIFILGVLGLGTYVIYSLYKTCKLSYNIQDDKLNLFIGLFLLVFFVVSYILIPQITGDWGSYPLTGRLY